jgi:stage II sporulation protein D
MRRIRSVVSGIATAVALVATAAPAGAVDVVGRPPDGQLLLDGRGFGHGRGMSQYGAYGAALRGLNHEQILGFYYTGAQLDTAPGARRRVLLTGEDADMVVTNVPGLALRDEPSGRIAHTGDRADWSRVRVRPDGTVLRVEALQGGVWVEAMPPVSGPVHAFGPPTLELHHPAGLRRYRDTLTAARSGQPDKPLYVVSGVSIDDYIRGVVPAEMPSGWHEQALRAQAVAARSYGMQPCPQPSAYPATGLYDVVDTVACQVYRGVNSETARANAAVEATSGQVIRFNGTIVRAEFSASSGGWTVFNNGPFVAKEDPYDAVGAAAANRSEVHRWTGVPVPLSKLEAAFGTGPLREVRVLQRDGNGEWGGRVLKVRLVGDTRTVDVTGAQVRSAAGLRSTWFDFVSPIDAKHAALGGNAGFLGAPVGPEGPVAGGRFRPYRGGSIYWTLQHGAYEVHGAIRDRYGRTGWENGVLGFPVTDELATPDRVGRFNHFQRGSIYWTPGTGAYEVHGAIRDTWARLGSERSAVGYPLTDELTTPDRIGRYNHFQRGSIYWTPSTGAHEVRGAIRERWAAMGWETGPLGYPLTDELGTPDGRGRFNHFEGGSIYWTPVTGAHDVRGVIRQRWAQSGWETGRLGFPVSDEYAVPGGRRSDFEHGSIIFDAATGTTRVI